MLSVLNACDCCAVLSWSGDSVWGLNEREGVLFRPCFDGDFVPS
jgi:hypothetical protein